LMLADKMDREILTEILTVPRPLGSALGFQSRINL